MEKLKKSYNFIIKIILRLLEKNKIYDLGDKSAVITYYLLLSIGPFLVLMFSILSYFLTDNIDLVLDFVDSIYEDARVILDPILEYLKSSQSAAFAIIGLVATLFSSSKSSKQIIASFKNIFKNKEETGIKSLIFTNIYAMLFTLALVVSIIIFFVFFVTGDPIAYLINMVFQFDLSQFWLWSFVKTFMPIIFLAAFVTIIFKIFSGLGEENKSVALFEAFIGAIFVTLGWVLGSALFSFYVKNFNTNNAVYGALGSIMVIMLWFYILIYMLLLGAALIMSYREIKAEETNKKDDIKIA